MTKSPYENDLPDLDLGKDTEYPNKYSPEQLKPVSRDLNRKQLGIDTLPFKGYDVWNGYEFSWLNNKGKPEVVLLKCVVPATSPNIIESKSFKLYLNSFNQTRFSSQEEVVALLSKDLSVCAGATVDIEIHPLENIRLWQVESLPGECIDHIDTTINHYQPAPELLQVDCNVDVQEELHSNLLKSNCLITNQPDWASIYIHYKGPKIDQESLLRYIVSFRLHNEFHEQCVERFFCDILQRCKPDKLTVMARYTRRGGLDINPFRSNFQSKIKGFRTVRQ